MVIRITSSEAETSKSLLKGLDMLYREEKSCQKYDQIIERKQLKTGPGGKKLLAVNCGALLTLQGVGID